MIKINRLFFILVLVIYSPMLFAFDLEVDVLSSDYQPISLLISDFYTDGESDEVYKAIKKTVAKDINESGVFDLRFSFEQLVVSNVDLKNVFSTVDIYPYSNYQYIVVGKIIYLPNEDIYNLEVSVLGSNGHILKNFGYKIEGDASNKELKKIGHDIANEIYEAALDIKGYFTSSLLFVSGNKLIMSDYNGENQEVVLKTKGTVFSPSFSNDGKMIVYVDFFEGRSVIYLYDIYFKKIIKLANFKGLSLSPVFSSDGKKIIFSIANEGATHIYEATLSTGQIQKLTNGYSINMPGNYSLDNKYIVFNSDRTGSPKIYVLESETKSLRRVSKELGTYYTPSFSSNSNLILFTKIYNNIFQIGLLSLSGKEKILSEDTLAESPAWLIDGRHIIYQYVYKKSGSKNLYSFYIMDLLSGHKLLINPAKDAQDPSLSKGVIPTKKISAKYYF